MARLINARRRVTRKRPVRPKKPTFQELEKRLLAETLPAPMLHQFNRGKNYNSHIVVPSPLYPIDYHVNKWHGVEVYHKGTRNKIGDMCINPVAWEDDRELWNSNRFNRDPRWNRSINPASRVLSLYLQIQNNEKEFLRKGVKNWGLTEYYRRYILPHTPKRSATPRQVRRQVRVQQIRRRFLHRSVLVRTQHARRVTNLRNNLRARIRTMQRQLTRTLIRIGRDRDVELRRAR